MKTLKTAINRAGEEKIDGLWAILKYREIGIMRKLKSMSALLGLREEEVISEAPQDENNRILDYTTRQEIHETLLEASKKILS
tara:strand:- start:73 stop:321 length:249 start_codon:yes stop_codon:yes gene_type:complete